MRIGLLIGLPSDNLRLNHGSRAEFLDELLRLLAAQLIIFDPDRDLLERLVVDEAGRIFGNVELPLLNVFAELPEHLNQHHENLADPRRNIHGDVSTKCRDGDAL